MMNHEDVIRIRHMLDAAEEVQSLCSGKSRDDFENDRMLELAATRLLEIVGEAAAKISQETRETVPGIPWTQIIGLRNRLIHGYDNVDLDVLTDVIREDVPALIIDLKSILD